MHYYLKETYIQPTKPVVYVIEGTGSQEYQTVGLATK